MYKETPWTLERKKKSRTRKSTYIKERQADLEISTARVKQLFELNKERTFTTSQIAEALKLSEGTISSIMNRLITIGDISVVTMQRPHWAPVFQHADSASFKVPFSYKKQDTILEIINEFRNNINEIYTKEILLTKISCSESMLRRSLQILLTNGEIKLVGTLNGYAQYQHKSGKAKKIPINFTMDTNYMLLTDYLQKNNLNKYRDKFTKELKNKYKLFYTSTGIRKQYLLEDLNKVTKNLNKKGILDKLFN